VIEHATRKLARKGCDLLVVNDVSGGGVFGQDDNRAVILAADGSQTPVPAGSKRDLAHVIWDQVSARWPGGCVASAITWHHWAEESVP
jgi:phosphopantothenoylcysteine decarboxylase/phosphopantothenate--cysteine ligase